VAFWLSMALGEAMRFRVLGPLQVSGSQRDVQVSSPKPRTVLARLLVTAPHPVTSAALIEEVWSDRPPPSATNTLQTYISQLRQLLEPDRVAGQEPRVLRSVPGGYLIDVEPHQLDSWVFEELLREGRAALAREEPDKAAERLRQGLTLWRGPAFADVEGVTARCEAARLDQQRLVALDLAIQAELALGRHPDLIGELEQLVREHPLQEQFVAHLMLALYRSQRQADALAVYRDAYDRLQSEVGVSPGPALQDLHQRILEQDPALEPTAAAGFRTAATDRPEPRRPAGRPPTDAERPRPRLWSSRWSFAVLTGAALVLAGFAGLHAAGAGPWQGREPTSPTPPPAGSTVNAFDLAVHPGMGYDLDIRPGMPADLHSTNNPRSPDYAFLDFYRTSAGARPGGGQISGVSLTNDYDDQNAIHKIGRDQTASTCLGLPDKGPFVPMSELRAGDHVCLHTHEHRWAFITVSRMPSEPEELLFLHITVLHG
jgi:DNA-binding SARP family transcriptional activator